MIHILKTEMFRLKKSGLFWAMLGVVATMPLVSVLLNVLLFNFVSLDASNMSVQYDVWELMRTSNITIETLSALPSLTGDSLFALICTSVFLSKEFGGGTFRNMLLANRSRRDVYISFLLIAVTIGAAYLGASFVSTLLFNALVFGFGTIGAAKVVTACVLSLTLGLISVIFLQSMMCMFMFGTRKLAVALACPLVFCIFAPAMLYSFVETFAQFGIVTEADMSWVPLYNLNMLDFTAIDGALIGKILLYLVPLTALFISLGWITFRKADLK